MSNSNYARWWIIAYRLLLAPLLFVSLTLFCFSVFLVYGPREAVRAWRDN